MTGPRPDYAHRAVSRSLRSMPFYEYHCANCGHHHEELQKVTDKPLKKCPACGERKLHRLISAPVFRLKGGGWYETDFKSDKESKRNLAGDGEPAEKKTEPADKPAEKAESKPEPPKEKTEKSGGKTVLPVKKPASAAKSAKAKPRPVAKKPASAAARRAR